MNASVAGLAMPAGALLSRVCDIQRQWLQQELRYGIMVLRAVALISGR